MTFPQFRSAEDLISLVQEIGFLPFFCNALPGFSVEECTPFSLWFSGDVDGPWEWKGPVIVKSGCAYGKLFSGKAGFVSREWYPDFANYRRDGYDFDARYDEGLARRKDKLVYDALGEQGELLSKALKRMCGFGKGGQSGFDGVITRLQMQGYVVTTDFVYQLDRYGAPYGWGVARYATPERHFGPEFAQQVYCREPEQSGERMAQHLEKLFPSASEKQIAQILG